MSETMYKKYFENANQFIECDCSSCDKKYECADANLSESCKQMQEAIKKYNETCPEGSKPAGGNCARVGMDGKLGAKLQNICNVGYRWDGNSGKCISHVDKK
jgi:hypothetical protein